MNSINNRLILEPYKGSNKVEAKINSGFATVKQKSTLIGLKLLVGASVITMNGKEQNYQPGSIAYFEEETLHASAWAKKTYECDSINEKFIIAEFDQVVLIKESASV